MRQIRPLPPKGGPNLPKLKTQNPHLNRVNGCIKLNRREYGPTNNFITYKGVHDVEHWTHVWPITGGRSHWQIDSATFIIDYIHIMKCICVYDHTQFTIRIGLHGVLSIQPPTKHVGRITHAWKII